MPVNLNQVKGHSAVDSFGRGNWLRRELEHRCFLALEQVSQQHHSPVRKFQGIMMGSRVVLIDLPKMAVV